MFKKIAFTLLAIIAFNTAALTGASAAPADAVSTTVKSGSFEGRNDHVTTGGVSIVKTSSGYVAVLEGDFSLDGAPAPTLGFGKNGKFDEKTEFTKLGSISGLQVYQIPGNINPSNFTEFYVWCSDFEVSLGVAALN